MTEILKVEQLRKSFGTHEVLKGIDMTVNRGETICVVGASGSGKSTFLRCLNFMEIPTAGRIAFDGQWIGRQVGDAARLEMAYRERDLARTRARIGMVFQQFNLFPHLDVLHNVMLAPVRILRKSKAEARKIALEQLDHVGLADKAGSYPEQLSGGQQQRVAIARALAMEPDIMLFDEATSSLDPELVGEVLQTMRSLASDGMTMVVVTHELGFAFNVANRVMFLHEGLIHEEGPAQEVMMRPQKERTKQFFQSVTRFSLPACARTEMSG